MFGVRRSNVSYKRKTDVRESNISSFENNNINEEQEDIYKSSKFIFYDDKKKFTNQLEIYILLKNYNNKKLLVIIGSESTIEELKNQIKESLESLPELKDINGVKAEGIYKISNDNKITIPEMGKVGDFVNSGDILYCNLIADEFWIKTYYNLQSFNFKKIIKLEYKLKKKMRYKKFKLMLMKGGIQLFIENIKSFKKHKLFNYYLKLFEFKIKKYKKIITHNIHNKQKDKTTIDKIINYSSEIIVILKFGLFEKLIHQNIKLPNFNSNNHLRVNEYNDLSFEELVNDKKFLPEFKAIKELSEDFLFKQYNEKNPIFLFFTKKKNRKPSNEYSFSMRNIPNLKEEKKIIDELNDEDEEKTIKGDMSNLNIGEISREMNSIKNCQIDNNSLNRDLLTENLIENENKENKNEDKKKSKSLFYKNVSDNNELNIIKKEEKIKNMIILAQFLIKEDKKENKFMKKISCKDFGNNYEFYKNKPIIYSPPRYSNRNLAIYDNKNNINFLMEEDDERSFKLQEYNDENDNDKEIEIETKPKTFSDKNILQNNLLFKTFNNSRNNSKEIITELFLDEPDENENIYTDNISTKINKDIIKQNQNYSEPYNEDNGSNSNIGDENDDDLNLLQNQKSRRETLLRRSTSIHEQKKSLFSAFRNKQNLNLSKEIKSLFDYELFLNEIKKLCNNFSDKKALDKIKMPQSKEMEYLEKEYKFLIESRKTKYVDELKFGSGEFHIYIFMSILLIFSAMILVCLNIEDLMSVFS